MQPPPLSHLTTIVREKSGHDWLDRWRTSENGRLTYNLIPNKLPPHEHVNAKVYYQTSSGFLANKL